jgi:hypothetical protein
MCHDRSYFEVPAQAKECVLAYTRVPTLVEEWGRDAAGLVQELAWCVSMSICLCCYSFITIRLESLDWSMLLHHNLHARCNKVTVRL